MKISDLIPHVKQNYVENIIQEREFDRFSRTTSAVSGKVCVFVGSRSYINTIPKNAAMVITTQALMRELPHNDYGLCISTNPKATYFKLLNYTAFNIEAAQKENRIGVGCHISEKAYIAPHNVVIGDNVTIEEFASIYDNVTIGDNSVIHAGARIGIQDYGY